MAILRVGIRQGPRLLSRGCHGPLHRRAAAGYLIITPKLGVYAWHESRVDFFENSCLMSIGRIGGTFRPWTPAPTINAGSFLHRVSPKAEFYGRPLDKPQRVTIAGPSVGDDETVCRSLFGRVISVPEPREVKLPKSEIGPRCTHENFCP